MTDALPALTADDVAAWVRHASAAVAEHAEELTGLDAAIGDADHGANMKRGFAAAVDALDAASEGDGLTTPSDVLKKVATTLISKVGGASGPLYGTFFLRAATASQGAESLDAAALAAAVEAGVGGIAQRGKSEPGEKTMLDAWHPALEALKGGDSLESATAAAADAAEAGRDATVPMRATKGRASYLAERSEGHMDPGAASTALIVRALADVVAGNGVRA